MRQVLRRVREDQGPDAVILSNRRVAEGIEVIAAVDYDEGLVQQAMGSAPRAARATTSQVSPQAAVREPAVETLADQPAPQRQASVGEVNDALQGDVRQATPKRSLTDRSFEFNLDDDSAVYPSPDHDLHGDALDNAALRSLQCEVSSMRGILETQLSELLWKDVQRKSPSRVQILRNLTRLGIGPDVANIIANRLGPIDDPKKLWRAPLTELAQTLPLKDDDLLRTGGVAALVGPTGVGKTTTIAKMAFRYAIENSASDIALISADAHRIGAREHLATFAKLLGVTVYPAEDLTGLEQLLDQLSDKSLVLIDTEGTSQRNVDLTARLAAYGQNDERVRFYLTLAASCQEAGLDETVRVFNRIPLSGAIVTKIDEAAQLGCVLGSLIRHDLPAAYLSDGQRIPDDLHAAARKRLWLVNQAIDCSKASGIKINEEQMIERFASVGAAHA